MGSPLEIKSPLKGVIKDEGFQDFPPDASVDSLNVRPYDLGGRKRVAQRAGLDKVWAAAFTAGQPIQAMMQTTIALDPATVSPTTLLINETFSYANGNLATVSAGVWTNSNILVGSGGGSGTVAVSGSQCSNTGNDSFGVYYTSPPFVGTSFTVRATCSMTPLLNPQYFLLAFEIDTASPTNTGWAVRLDSGGGGGGTTVRIIDHSGVSVASGAGPSITAGVSFLLEVRVSGSVATAYVNGTSYTSYNLNTGTPDPYSGNNGVGFMYNSNAAVGNATFTLDTFQVLGGGTVANLRQTNVVVVCNGSVYEGTNLATPALVTGGSAVLSKSALPSMAYSAGHAYIVDGFSIQDLNLSTKVISAMVATAGTLPFVAGAPNKYPTIAAVWRDRLVLAAPSGTPQNFYLSRVGTPTDWDYSQQDSAAAFAGNASTAGHIGEPIIALIPFSDDVLFIGGDHNMWVVRGDPGDGGSIDLVTDSVGIVGMNAWTKGPDGTIYYVGTGGLYKITPGSTLPVNISSNQYNEFFRSINRANQYVVLSFDRDQQGFHIFVTAINTGTSTHIWYDMRTGSMWPIQFPDSTGPICSLIYDGDAATDRTTLLGGRDGYVRQSKLTDKDDDGVAIPSYVWIGPIKSSDTSEQLLEWQDVILGEPPSGFTASDWNCQVDVYSHSTVEKAFNSPLYNRRKIYTAPRRQVRWVTRQRGAVFFFKISNAVQNKTWSFEKITAMFTPAGTVRRR